MRDPGLSNTSVARHLGHAIEVIIEAICSSHIASAMPVAPPKATLAPDGTGATGGCQPALHHMPRMRSRISTFALAIGTEPFVLFAIGQITRLK